MRNGRTFRGRRKDTAFGLIEILVVLLIVMILAAAILPRYLSGGTDKNGKHVASPTERAHQAEGSEYIGQINQAILMYKNDHEDQNPPNLLALKSYGVMTEMLFDPNTHKPLAYDPQTGRVGNSNGVYSLGGGKNLPQVGQ